MNFSISGIIYLISKKELILVNPHRQTMPLLKNPENRKNYVFLNVVKIWRIIPFRSSNKMKFRIMYSILNVLHPLLIINVSWISKWDSLYKVWTHHHPGSYFAVIQHGAGIGGIRTRFKSTKCDLLLTWGDYFSRQYSNDNPGKNVQFISFGNPVYNVYNRDDFKYSNKRSGRILLAPSAVSYESLDPFISFCNKLEELGFILTLKEHNYQGKKAPHFDYPALKGFEKSDEQLYSLLLKRDYDFVVTDHSSALLDIIFFKNPVLFFSPEGSVKEYTVNLYSDYLKNAYFNYRTVENMESVYSMLDIEAQERLFSENITPGSNNIKEYIFKKKQDA